MTFVKGQSGNPSGRKPVDPLVQEMFSRLIPQAMAAVEECLKSPRPEIKLKASELIFDRSWGRPAQAVEVSGKDGGPLVAVIKENA